MEAELKFILESIQGQIKDNKESVDRGIRYGLKGVRAHVDANSEILNGRMNLLIESDKRRNGNIQDNSDDIKAIGIRVDKTEDKVKVIGWMGRRWYLVLAGIICLGIFSSWAFHNVSLNIKETIKNTTGIVIEDANN